MTIQSPNYDEIGYPEMPNGWAWWSGNVSAGHYTRWFGTEYRRGGDLVGVDGSIGGFEGQVYWDEGNDHTVEIIPITGVENDDPVTGYATITRQYGTMQEAVEAVPDLIESLKEQ